MEALRDRWLIAAEANDVLDNPAHPSWLPAAKFVHEATAGKPAQAIDLTSQGQQIFVAEVPAKSPTEDEWARQHSK